MGSQNVGKAISENQILNFTMVSFATEISFERVNVSFSIGLF
jgi:hypothetical protein